MFRYILKKFRMLFQRQQIPAMECRSFNDEILYNPRKEI